MMKIYGSPMSSAGRCYVMLEECGVSYERMPLNMGSKEHKSEEFLKINPNGKVPCLVDGDFVIWESAAILHYLAEKFKPEMLATGAQNRALVQQWCFWGMTECQPPLVDILIQKVFVPEGKRDLALIERRERQVPHYLDVLNKSLQGKSYLVGETYTLADLLVGSVVNLVPALGMDLSAYPNVVSWFKTISQREAFKKVASMREQEKRH